MTPTDRPHRRSIAVATLLAGIGMLVAGCGGDEATTGDTEPDPATAETADSSTSTANDGTSADGVEIEGDDADDALIEDARTDDPDRDEAGTSGDAEELFPDVIGATAEQDDAGSWTFSATLSSPYDTPARYADAWRVVGPDGEVYGIRELAHDHASEQPFTRSRSGIVIPEDVITVTVEGRDQVSGWGGATVEVTLER